MLTNKAKSFLKKYQSGGFTNVDNFTQNNQNKYLTSNLLDKSPLQQLPTGFDVMQQKAMQPPQIPQLPSMSRVQPQAPQEQGPDTIDQVGSILGTINPGAKVVMGVKNIIESNRNRKRAKQLKGFYAEDLAERKKDTKLNSYVNTPYASYQMGGNLDATSAGYSNQQDYNDNVQRQFEEYYSNLNQQNTKLYKEQQALGFSGLAGAYTQVYNDIKSAASMGMAQDGGEMQTTDTTSTVPEETYNSHLDINSEEFNKDEFLGKEVEKEEIKNTERDELMKWVMEDEEDTYSPIQADYMNYEAPEGEAYVMPESDTNAIIQKIGYNESRGNYGVVNDVSGTTGKYQFHPTYWGPQIRDYMNLPASTPISTVMEDFRTNPKVQEEFMSKVVEEVYKPQIPKLMGYASKYGFNQEQLIRLMHYRGIDGAKKRLMSGDFSISAQEKAKYKNPEILDYLNK